MKMNQNNAGFEPEKLAATFLMNHGLKMVTQNYHCRFGEIDLIMMDAKTLVFVEVRLRSNSQFGSAGTSITAQKKQKFVSRLLLINTNFPGYAVSLFNKATDQPCNMVCFGI